MIMSASASSALPKHEVSILFCVRCETKIGPLINSWISLTSSYARPIHPFLAQNLEVNSKTQIVPNGSSTNIAEGCHMASLFCRGCSVMVGQRCIEAPAQKSRLVGQQFFKISRVALKSVSSSGNEALIFDENNDSLLDLQLRKPVNGVVHREANSRNNLLDAYNITQHQSRPNIHRERVTPLDQDHELNIERRFDSLQEHHESMDETAPDLTNVNTTAEGMNGSIKGSLMNHWIGRLSTLDEDHSQTSRRLAAQEQRMFRLETIARSEDEFTRSLQDQVHRLESSRINDKLTSKEQAELIKQQQKYLDKQNDEILGLSAKLESLQQMVIALVGAGKLPHTSTRAESRKRKRVDIQDDEPINLTSRTKRAESIETASEDAEAQLDQKSVEPEKSSVSSAAAIDFSDDEDSIVVVHVPEQQQRSTAQAKVVPETSLLAEATPSAELSVAMTGDGNVNLMPSEADEENSEQVAGSDSNEEQSGSPQIVSGTSANHVKQANKSKKRERKDINQSQCHPTYEGQSEDEITAQEPVETVKSTTDQPGITDDTLHPQDSTSNDEQIKTSRKVIKRHRAPAETSPVAKENDDDCSVCNRTGKLICCDGCPKAYHRRCLDRDSTNKADSDEDWFCPSCVLAQTTHAAISKEKSSQAAIKQHTNRPSLIERDHLAKQMMDRQQGSANR